MKSSVLGKNTSQAEVQDITRHGVWLFVKGQEYLLPFKAFPWFKDAKVSAVYNVILQHQSHLYWPDLDVDLAVASIDETAAVPLVSRPAKAAGARRA